jgi:hypothetical protein
MRDVEKDQDRAELLMQRTSRLMSTKMINAGNSGVLRFLRPGHNRYNFREKPKGPDESSTSLELENLLIPKKCEGSFEKKGRTLVRDSEIFGRMNNDFKSMRESWASPGLTKKSKLCASDYDLSVRLKKPGTSGGNGGGPLQTSRDEHRKNLAQKRKSYYAMYCAPKKPGPTPSKNNNSIFQKSDSQTTLPLSQLHHLSSYSPKKPSTAFPNPNPNPRASVDTTQPLYPTDPLKLLRASTSNPLSPNPSNRSIKGATQIFTVKNQTFNHKSLPRPAQDPPWPKNVYNSLQKHKSEGKKYFLSDMAKSWIKVDENYFSQAFNKCLLDLFETIKVGRSFLPVNQQEITSRLYVDLNPTAGEKILFLDMDETLIHSELIHDSPACTNFDELNAKSSSEKYILFSEAPIKINMRPYLYEFLEQMRGIYTLVLFTSSLKDYADLIIHQFDPGDRFFKYRFYRDHCVKGKN